MKTNIVLKIVAINMFIFIIILGLSPLVKGADNNQSKCILSGILLFRPDNLAMAIRSATNIVTAKVIHIELGPKPIEPDIPPPGADPDLYAHVHSTQLITLEVMRPLKGGEMKEFSIAKIGDDVCYAKEDPPYHVGDVVVLFLAKLQDKPGNFMLIAPEGRFAVIEGKIIPMATHGGYVEQWRGRSLDEFEQQIKVLKDHSK